MYRHQIMSSPVAAIERDNLKNNKAGMEYKFRNELDIRESKILGSPLFCTWLIFHHHFIRLNNHSHPCRQGVRKAEPQKIV